MTIVKANLNRNHLRAALRLAAKADIRNYLNGALVELNPGGSIYIVATDGSAMGAFQGYDEASNPATRVECVIPRDLLASVKVYKYCEHVTLTYDTETRDITLTDIDTSASGKAVEGGFPNWRRVMPPRTGSGVATRFDPALLARFVDAAVVLGRKAHAVTLGFNGDDGVVSNAIYVRMEDEPCFRGVLMPFRQSGAPDRAPDTDLADWATPAPAPAPAPTLVAQPVKVAA